MDSLKPTLMQIKQSAKLINRYLKTLEIDLSHSTALDVASNGFGFKNYNDAKETLTSAVTKKRSYHSIEEEFVAKFMRYGADEKDARKAARLSLSLGRDIEHFDWAGYDEEFISAVTKVYSDFIYDLCEHHLGGWNDGWGSFMVTEQRDDIINEAIVFGPLYSDTIASILGADDLYEFHNVFEKEKSYYGFDFTKVPSLIPTMEYISDYPMIVKMTKGQLFGCAVASGVEQDEAEEFAQWLYRFNGGYVDRMLFYSGYIADARSWKRWFVDEVIEKVAFSYGKDTHKMLQYYKGAKGSNRTPSNWIVDLDEMIDSGVYVTRGLAEAIQVDFMGFGLSAEIEAKKYIRANEEPRDFKDYYVHKERVDITHVKGNFSEFKRAIELNLTEDEVLAFMKEVQEKILDCHFSDQGYLSLLLPDEDEDYVHRDEDDKYSIDAIVLDHVEELTHESHRKMIKKACEKSFGVELFSPLIDCYKIKRKEKNG